MTCKPCTQTITVTGTLTNSKGVVVSSVSHVPKPSVPISSQNNTCPTNSITHIGKVGNKIVVTMDDCTFYTTSLDKLDLASFNTVAEVVTDVSKQDDKFIITKTNLFTGEVKEYELT